MPAPQVQALIDAAFEEALNAELAADAAVDVQELQAALAADDAAQAAALAAKDAEIATLTARIAELEAAPPPAAALPTLSVSDAPTRPEASGPAVFTVTLSAPYDRSITFDYATVNGTAVAGQDFTAKSGTLVFSAGQTSKTVSVDLLNDTAVEGNEAFTLKISNVRVAVDTAPDTGTGTITSEDTTPPPVEPPPTGTLMWPKSSNTGHSGTLTAYTGGSLIRTNGLLVENKRITSMIQVDANNVTFRNCLFQFAANGLHAIWQNDGFHTLILEDCTIDGRNSSRMTGVATQANGIVRRCDIFGMVIGVKQWGNGCILEDSYIHDLVELSSNPDDRHFDGVANLGASNCIVRRNAIIMPSSNGGTAGIFFSGQQGAISGSRFENNLITGQASYNVYAERSSRGMTNTIIANNYIERGIFGYILNDSGATETNNTQWNDATQAAPAPVVAWRAAA